MLNYLKKSMKKIIIYVLILIFSINLANSQSGNFGLGDARTVALGNTGNALSQGLLSINRNPSLLINRLDTGYLHFVLPFNMSIQATTNTLDIKDVKYYFGGDSSRFLTDLDKKNLVNAFDGDGKFIASANINAFSLAFMPSKEIGAFGISVNDYIYGSIIVPKQMVDLLLNGNNVNQTYSFNTLEAQSSWIRSYGLSYARELINKKSQSLRYVSMGASVKLFQGYQYVSLKSLDTKIYTSTDNKISGQFNATGISSFSQSLAGMNPFNNDTSKVDISPMPEASGSGIGIDFGISGEFKFGMKFGVSINDLGSMNWDKNLETHTITKSFKLNDLLNKNELDSILNGSKDSTVKGGSVKTDLPTVLRLGLLMPVDSLFEVPGELNLLVDMNIGLSDFANNSKKSRLSLGLDWAIHPDAPRLMTGFSTDQTEKWRLSFGLGYNSKLIDFYIATFDLLSAISPSNNASIAFTLVWKIM